MGKFNLEGVNQGSLCNLCFVKTVLVNSFSFSRVLKIIKEVIIHNSPLTGSKFENHEIGQFLVVLHKVAPIEIQAAD